MDKQSFGFLIDHNFLEAVESLGIQLIIESWGVRYFKRNVVELDFSKEVGQWQHELLSFLNTSSLFRPYDTALPDSTSDPYQIACEQVISYAVENDMDLLTDDRMMQMIWNGDWGNRQYGTDVLLKELFDKEILKIYQYIL